MFAGLNILLVGITVVMAVLLMLWASCAIVGFGFRMVEARQKASEARKNAAAAAAAPPSALAATPAGGIPAHHLAAIAAATAAVMDRPYRIVQVWAPVVPTSDWGNQARLQTFNSHRRQGDWGRSLPALNPTHSQAR
ncbi:hypothetical protein F1188_01050 [Roseospira marina]|uniref:Oxaloacetate decarboxylase gamma chain n=1 Tax=Roseospira marina TaxID=140057 RepID=A0A5M6IGM9_9PROT|nr:OadG family transporter subunit [Roseospira marina]KAA5607384.1 hypothetical protein F1188_01050 [Roseospira marina]MBB4312446.1 Na+-transporting methylmalonyl-CoA/oxaloacetate decarboxylase gamma subunit [Roseospira marina]MBB5085538.1 Na+-transporting methylmalonyl-CoA/oxaloacetate decarboxylase gamma subunit [Roseospira marina]